MTSFVTVEELRARNNVCSPKGDVIYVEETAKVTEEMVKEVEDFIASNKPSQSEGKKEERGNTQKSWSQIIKENSNDLFLKAVVECKTSEGPTSLNIEAWRTKEGNLLIWKLSTDKLCYNNEDTHPFMCIQDNVSGPFDNVGEKVADNEYSRTLIQWIAKSDKELEGKTGTQSPSRYRARLIEQLAAMYN